MRVTTSEPALFLGELHGLGAVAGAELADRGAEVVPHRAFGEVQVRCDLGRGRERRRRGEDVVLALGERADAVRGSRRSPADRR
jgi:hypothetical protein